MVFNQDQTYILRGAYGKQRRYTLNHTKHGQTFSSCLGHFQTRAQGWSISTP